MLGAGKGSLVPAVCDPTQPCRNGPWAWDTSFPGDKALILPVPGLSCVGMSSSVVWTWSTLHPVLWEEGMGSFDWGIRGVHVSELSWIGCQRDPQAGAPMLTIGADLALSPVYVSKALFYLVLIVLCFTCFDTRCNGQKCLESPPGTDNWCTVFG